MFAFSELPSSGFNYNYDYPSVPYFIWWLTIRQQFPKFERVWNVTKNFQKLPKRKHEFTRLNKIWWNCDLILSNTWLESDLDFQQTCLSLLNKISCSAVALGLTKILAIVTINLVTLLDVLFKSDFDFQQTPSVCWAKFHAQLLL